MNEAHAEENTAPRTTAGPFPTGKILRWVLRGAAVLLALIVLFLAVTPMGRYIVRAATQEAKILWRRRPISAMLADTTLARATRTKLQLVLDARTFAENALGLKAGK